MPLFGPKYEPGAEGPSLVAQQGIFGGAVDPVEGPGALQRRGRMFHEALRLARSGADVRTEMARALEKEQSFIKWVSLRGALLDVVIVTENGNPTFEEVVAKTSVAPPDGTAGLVARYERISEMSFSDVLVDPSLVRDNDWHLDLIAWAAAAHIAAAEVVQVAAAPRAGKLTAPGWYTEPTFGKSERFWDGRDWTSRCRVLDGRTYRAISSPF